MPYRVYADRQAYNAKIKCEIINILYSKSKKYIYRYILFIKLYLYYINIYKWYKYILF